nr:hypothetical protein [uncultured Jannaschia sp.]
MLRRSIGPAFGNDLARDIFSTGDIGSEQSTCLVEGVISGGKPYYIAIDLRHHLTAPLDAELSPHLGRKDKPTIGKDIHTHGTPDQ